MPRPIFRPWFVFPILLAVIAFASPSMGDDVVFKTWNTESCDYTKWAMFKLSADARVENVIVWRHWERETRVPFSLIDSKRKVLYKGSLQRGLCDPFQQQWCRGKSALNLSLKAGVYAVEVEEERLCQNTASKGQGFIIVKASPGSGASKPAAAPVTINADAGKKNVSEILDPARLGVPGRKKETWVRKWSEDGSFDLWVTGGRNLHCLFMPSDWPEADGWETSGVFPAYKYRCREYQVKKAVMVAEKQGRVESLDPAKSGDPGHHYESWLRLTNKNGAFHLWITDGRDMHCIFKPKGFKNTKGWPRSTIYKNHVVLCNTYHPISMKPDGKSLIFDKKTPGKSDGEKGGAEAKKPPPTGKTGRAKPVKCEVLDPAAVGAPERRKETWVRAWNREGGFDLWATGGVDMHCLFMPSDWPGARDWKASDVFAGFKYRCRGYQTGKASMIAEKSGRVESVDPAKLGFHKFSGETWITLTNKNGGYHMWVTDGRDLHCLFEPKGSARTRGWKESNDFNTHVFACNTYHPISMKPGGQSDTFSKKAPAAPTDAGGDPGRFRRGLDAAGRGDHAAAYKEWLPLARGGDVHAQFNIAIMHDNGKGVSENKAKAARWYRAAARQGFAPAQQNLALCFYRGEGVDKNKSKAIHWFRKAADQGSMDAQYNLGLMYIKGDGVEKNAKKAFSYFKKAGEQGVAKAQFNTALMYDNGQGTKKDKTKAARWYRAAADQGLGIAQHNLGLSYYHGEGVPKDHSEALRWFLACEKTGQKGCAKNAKILKKAGVKKPSGPPPGAKSILLTGVTRPSKPAPGPFVSPPSPPAAKPAGKPVPASSKPAHPPAAAAGSKPKGKPAPKPAAAPSPKPAPAPKPEKGAPAGISAFSSLGENEFGYKEYKHKETGMVFVLIPAGKFIMGRNDFKPFKPEHEVFLDAYLIGKYEVAQGVWERYMGEIPSYYLEGKGENYPVGHASWNTWQEFLQKTGLSLPTEAEWEKACKAGTQTKFYWGDDYEGRDAHAWYDDNSGNDTHPVGLKKPNGYGLYDMAGNVAEWCQDYHENSYIYYANSPKRNPMGPKTGSRRVHRGGSFRDGFRELWSAGRAWSGQTNRGVAGVRPVVRLNEKK